MTHRKDRKQISVPLILHDVKVSKADAEWLDVERISIVDVNLSSVEIEKLEQILEEHKKHATRFSTLGIRFIGRMVL